MDQLPGESVSPRIAVGPLTRLSRKLRLRFNRSINSNDVETKINGRIIPMETAENNWLVSSEDILNEQETKLVVEVTLNKNQKVVKWMDALIRDAGESK